MKRIVLICLVALCGYCGLNAHDVYYWYKGKKQPLEIVKNQQYILVKSLADANDLQKKMKKSNINSDFKRLSLSSSLKDKEAGRYWSIITLPEQMESYKDSAIIYSTPLFLTENKTLVGISHLFYVKLKISEDVGLLEKMAKENNAIVLGNNRYMPLWYTVSCTNESDGNALELANMFYETGLFLDAVPDIMVDDYSNCVNDVYFADQWGLKNIGQYNGTTGIDIHYCDARQITTGNSNIVVAVLDEGVEMNHPDLTNMYSLSFDTENGTSPSVVRGSHATACAGIIGAHVNNSIGIAGITPDCPIMSVSNLMASTPDSRMKRADGINFAWQNGASVISNSWGSDIPYQIIDDAISNAVQYGRNGKGCVVVFSSGNKHIPIVGYPACLENVIAVGAISSSGHRAFFSNYGSGLDLVAPGVNISTTDLQGDYGVNTSSSLNDYADRNYTNSFIGTSAACPFVSGVAALVLSVNPQLTAKHVKDILESSAQKIGGYSYLPNPNYSNGTWNEEMGYGLVDAYAALKLALSDLYIRDTVTDNGTIPSTVHSAYNSPDIWTADLDTNICNPTGGENCYVCVRVYNKSNSASSGYERLIVNWAKAGIGLPWSYGWLGSNFYALGVSGSGYVTDVSGISIPPIPAGGDTIIYILWHVPDPADYACFLPTSFNSEWWHFCLAARIHDGTPIVGENSRFLNMKTFTTTNNNVAWKNISIISEGCNGAVISTSNALDDQINCNIKLGEVTDGNGSTLTDYAEVYVTLDAGLLAAIDIANISGLTWVNPNVLRWNGGMACIPVILPANSNYALMTTVNFLADQIPDNNNFNFDIVLSKATGDSIIGGEHYQCIRTQGRYFQAVANGATTIVSGQSAYLYANDILESATYEWFDEAGNSVGGGIGCNVNPTQTTTYTLAVTADADGYKAYDQVTVTVQQGLLNSISPNPSNGQVTVSYRLAANVASATIQILNTNGQVVGSYPVSGCSSAVTGNVVINTSSMAAGSYTVRMVSSNGKVNDSKTLVIQ